MVTILDSAAPGSLSGSQPGAISPTPREQLIHLGAVFLIATLWGEGANGI